MHLHLAEEPTGDAGGAVALRYIARAGLIPELSAQTYDAFWKAIREAVLNSFDAGATRVDVLLPGPNGRDEVVIADDGCGMDMTALSEHFLSVGGSGRFGEADKFGRIGIGSLALLQYGERVMIETKVAGATEMCVAELRHREWIESASRRDLLGDIHAGTAVEVPYEGDPGDHFTRICLEAPQAVAREAGADPTARAELTERLRRVLPLAWPRNRLTKVLEATAPELAETLRAHADAWSTEVVLHSEWDDGMPLVRRQYGERDGIGEDWSGPLLPILKRLRVDADGMPSREIVVAGYLLSQTHASAAWSGLTARVQNVAVEERTFFDLVSDPGFRKYITGEVYLLGDVNRDRLINIDRASFNRESEDYLATQRYVADVLQQFKSRHVQQPQRLRVAARKLMQEHEKRLSAMREVVEMALEITDVGARALPSSGRAFSTFVPQTIGDALTARGCVVLETEDDEPSTTVGGDGHVVCRIPTRWMQPRLEIAGRAYRIVFGEASEDDLPVLIRARPREIRFNLSHPALRDKPAEAIARMLALELAYLDSADLCAEDLFERVLAFLTIT